MTFGQFVMFHAFSMTIFIFHVFQQVEVRGMLTVPPLPYYIVYMVALQTVCTEHSVTGLSIC